MSNEEIKKLDYGYSDYENEHNVFNKINEIINKINSMGNEVNNIKSKLDNLTSPCNKRLGSGHFLP